MNLNRLILIIFVLASVVTFARAQELNCQVQVDYSQVQGTNTSVFTTLENAISEYVNTRKWSNAQIAANEKIDCRMFFTIKSYEDAKFTGELQIQSSRPVYNSNYTTTMLNFKDTKIEFDYLEGQPLIFSENSMESNLTAILNFYVYLILAIDFDSFSERGGNGFYDQARNVVQLAQSTSESGWRAFEDNKNRSAVLNAYTEPSTIQFRDLIYQYHRHGLDEMSISPDKGRAAITASLETLEKIAKVAPLSVILSMFKDAKLDELVNVYTKGSQDERTKVYDLLYKIYPTETTRLDMIKRGVNK